MSFGKLYTFGDNPRALAIRAVAKEYKIDLEIVQADIPGGVSSDYLKLNPQGKIPTFEGSDGFVLTETIAIAIYIASQNEKTTLLGKTKQDYASIVRWMSFANSEFLPSLNRWVRPLLGHEPYNKKTVDEGMKANLKVMDALEQHLLLRTFLVGERITLADLVTAALVSRGFEHVFDKKWRADYPNVTRWYETVYHQPIYSAVVGKELNFIEEAVKYQPPKKEAAPKKEQAAMKKEAVPKAKAKEDEDDEEEDKPAPKPKHPLEALGKATMVLDDWKRTYSNEEMSVAMPWFWEHFKPEEYSLWRVDYKYNDELSMVFMSANLIGGFFNRLEASRKYLFGAMSVFGKTNASVIVGAFLVRGSDALPAFDVAPDYDSYTFTKLDPSKEEDRGFVTDQWEREKGVVVDGKEYPYADGKVFK